MRVNGRTLRPTTLAERRVLKRFGIDWLRVPRGKNPFAVARQIARAAKGAVPELQLIRQIVEDDRTRRPLLPYPFPIPVPTTPGPASPWCPDAQVC